MIPALCRCIPVMRCRRIVAIEAPRERIESMQYFLRHLLVAALLAATAWLPSESSSAPAKDQSRIEAEEKAPGKVLPNLETPGPLPIPVPEGGASRSEEHTSELQ